MPLHPTDDADLNTVLAQLVAANQALLADNFVGAYLHGSFAVGDPDEASTLIDPVPVDDLRRDVRSFMHSRGDGWFANPTHIGNRFFQPFTVLTYCRMLHTLATGTVVSKAAAAAWAQDQLEPRWTGLIQRAVADRPDPSRRYRTPADPDDVAETFEFMGYVIAVSDTFVQGLPATDASLHDDPRPSEPLVPSGRPWLLLGVVAVLCALIAGLVVGVRSQGAAPEPAIGGAPSPSEQRRIAGETRPEVTVQGLGTLPSLGVLQRWELGEGQPMIADVSEDLAVSRRGDRGFGLMRISDDQPPTVVGVAPAGEMHFAVLGAGGRRLVTIGSSGWKGDGSFAPVPSEIFDIEDPAHPRKVGEIILETDSQFEQPWGDYMLIGESRMDPTPLTGSLRIIQLVGADAGKEVGRLEGATRPIAVDGDRAFIIRSCGGRVQPTSLPPVVDGVVPPPPYMMGYDPAFPDCLAVVDLSDPSRPELIGERPMPDTAFPNALATYGGYVYMPTFGEGILIADARGAGAPVLLDARAAKGMNWQMLMDNFSPGGHLDVVVNGSVLYFGYHTTIAAFDLSTPAAPKPVAAIELGPEGYIDRLILTNNRLYVSTGNPIVASSWEKFALWVIDAPADPANLLRLGAAR